MKNHSPSLQDLQNEVDDWITTTGVRYFNELTNLAILTEEVGELARIMARRYGEQSEKESDRGADLGDEKRTSTCRQPVYIARLYEKRHASELHSGCAPRTRRTPL